MKYRQRFNKSNHDAISEYIVLFTNLLKYYLIFFTLHPRVASIRPLMGTPEGYNY